MECTQCTVYGMYTVNSCDQVFIVDFLLNSYKSKYTIRSCVRSKNVFESWKEGEEGALLCWAVTHFSCSALLHDSTLLWLDSTHSDENDAHAIIPAGDP